MEHYQRKNFLINKSFQIKYCVYVCSWLFALSFVYPFIIYEIFHFFLKYVSEHSPTMPVHTLKQVRGQIVGLLAMLQIMFLVVTFLISIFISHRIAGPLYKFSQWLQAGRDGTLRPDLFFRQYDYFREIATDYNLMVSGVFSRVDRNVAKLEDLLGKVDGSAKSGLQSVIDDLKKIREPMATPTGDGSKSVSGPGIGPSA